jgi:hypothetical protein
MVSPGDLDDYCLTAAEPGAREGAAPAPKKPRDRSMQYPPSPGAAAPVNQSREAYRSGRPHHSPEGPAGPAT